MRPQKPKNRANNINRVQNRFHSYYLRNSSCKFCVKYRGKKKGCVLSVCDFEEEKMDAAKHGKTKQNRGDKPLAM